MGDKKTKRLRATAKRPKRSARSGRAKRIFIYAAPLALIAVLVAGYYTFYVGKCRKPEESAATRRPGIVQFARKAKTLDDLLKIPANQLGDVDIAEMSLLCATGLPGAEKLDIDHARATLDLWADRVKFETERHLYRVTDRRYAEHYRHSEAYLRAEFLVQTLCDDLGVKYDQVAKDNFSFKDSRVASLHGMIPGPDQSLTDTPGGTCASMPVMYVAIGRRLGYPLKLVTTKGHIFVRWDGKDHPNPAWRERFNIEGAGEGFSSFPDSYYKTWPFKLTDRQVKANGYLVSLTPRQEFAQFLAARGHCGTDHGQPAFAARCYENAHGYDPDYPAYRLWFGDAALASGFRSKISALASLVARRMRRKTTRDPDLDGMQRPSDLAAAAATSGLPGVSQMNLGRWQPEPTEHGAPQPPTYRPGSFDGKLTTKPPQDETPPPGITNPHQPHQPPTPGQPQR